MREGGVSKPAALTLLALASLGTDGELTLWDTAAWRPFGKPVTDDQAWGFIDFPAEQRIQVMYENSRMVRVDIDRERRVEAACSAANRDLTPDEVPSRSPGTRHRRPPTADTRPPVATGLRPGHDRSGTGCGSGQGPAGIPPREGTPWTRDARPSLSVRRPHSPQPGRGGDDRRPRRGRPGQVRPPGGFDAGVTDIEVIDGTTIYYGSYQVVEDGEQAQRAVVWRGIDGTPEPIDTGLGMFADIAFELTSTGLVNRRSETRDGGVSGAVNWVLDLRTMRLTTLPDTAGQATDTTILARRVNDSGALVGIDVNGVGAGSPRRNGLHAVGWASPTSKAVRLAATGSGSTPSASTPRVTAAASSRSRSCRVSPTGPRMTRRCGGRMAP